MKKERKMRFKGISDSVSKWIGILNTRRTYKQLRNESIRTKLRKNKSTGRHNIIGRKCMGDT